MKCIMTLQKKLIKSTQHLARRRQPSFQRSLFQTAEKEKIHSELKIAKQIQNSMLPCISRRSRSMKI